MAEEILYVPGYPGQGTDVAPAFKQSGGGGSAPFVLPFMKNFDDYELGALNGDFVTPGTNNEGEMVTWQSTGGSTGYGDIYNAKCLRVMGDDNLVGSNHGSSIYKFPGPISTGQYLQIRLYVLGGVSVLNQIQMRWGVTKDEGASYPWDGEKGAYFHDMHLLSGWNSTTQIHLDGAVIGEHIQGGNTQSGVFSVVIITMDPSNGQINTNIYHTYNGFFKYSNQIDASEPVRAWLNDGNPLYGAYVSTPNDWVPNQYVGANHLMAVWVGTTGDTPPDWGSTIPASFGGYE